MSKKQQIQIAGIILLVLGAGLAYWGYSESSSYAGKFTKAISGSDSDKTIALYISSAVSFAIGLFLLIKKS